MFKIAIIDDRRKMRETLCRLVGAYCPEGWECIDFPPIENIGDYARFINDNNISVLILDEMLHEEAQDSDSHVNYNGHEIASLLRSSIPEYPIHVITSYRGDDDLQNSKAELDSIYDRFEFSQEADKIVPRIIRSAVRFHDVNEKKLAEYSALSEKLALGNIQPEDSVKLASLKQRLNIRYSDSSNTEVVELINSVEENLQKMDTLVKHINQILSGDEK
jgi:hypothetical protein